MTMTVNAAFNEFMRDTVNLLPSVSRILSFTCSALCFTESRTLSPDVELFSTTTRSDTVIESGSAFSLFSQQVTGHFRQYILTLTAFCPDSRFSATRQSY